MSLINQLDQNVATRTNYMAKLGASIAADDIRNRRWYGRGRNNTKSILSAFKTGAQENSFYWVSGDGESNYDDVKSDFQARLGRRRRFDNRTTEDLTFEQVKVESEKGLHRSAYASMSVILAFWEYGHRNTILRQQIPRRPTISYSLLPTVKPRFLTNYQDIMKK